MDIAEFGTGGEESAAIATAEGDPWAATVHPLVGRLKFACCTQCGTNFGMQHAHRDTLGVVDDSVLRACAPWYKSPDVREYLYCPCDRCNPQGQVPADFIPLTVTGVREWVAVQSGEK